VRFVAEQPNQRWQLDITHWALADDSEVEILNLLDDHSRLCVASQARRSFKAGDVDDCFGNAATHYGHPATVLSDTPQCSPAAPAARAVWPLRSPWPAEGSASGIRGPTTPRPAARSNGSTRPSSGGSPPDPGPGPCASSKPSSTASATTTTPSGPTVPLAGAPRSRPTRPDQRPSRPAYPLDDTHYRIRHDKIDPSGVFTLRHNSRLHHIGVGRRHAGTDILVLVHDRHVRVLTHDGELLRELHSTRPRTTNHNAKRERCRKTPVHGVSRHHIRCPWQDSNLQPAV
jgi:hypothetical protein